MRVVLISDTHENNINTKWEIPRGDVLIHAGDATARGRLESVAKFAREMQLQPHRFKLFVPGNHDRLFVSQREVGVAILSAYGVMTLIDEAIVLPGGLSIYGTPWQQVNPSDLRMLARLGYDSFSVLDPREHFTKIPEYVDILITHQPPHGILSYTDDGAELGSSQLANELQYRIHPRVHVFGHIHERSGWTYVNDCAVPLFVNAALCDPVNRPANKPVVIDIDDFAATIVEV